MGREKGGKEMEHKDTCARREKEGYRKVKKLQSNWKGSGRELTKKSERKQGESEKDGNFHIQDGKKKSKFQERSP